MVRVFAAAGTIVGFEQGRDAAGRLLNGHTLRPTGALAGFDPWVIAMLFRWGSAVVLRYVRDAPLALSHTWARRARLGLQARR